MTGVKKVTVTVEINDGTVLTLCGEPIGNIGNSAFVLQDIKSIIADITAKYAGITTAMYGAQNIIDEEKPRTSQQYRRRSHLLGEDGTLVLGLDNVVTPTERLIHYVSDPLNIRVACGIDRMENPRHIDASMAPSDVTCLACQQAMGRNDG